ncbi:MAG: hypothetical protein ACFHW5_06400 [Verrucomicrobiota bacterium]|jgi:hypothetical protein
MRNVQIQCMVCFCGVLLFAVSMIVSLSADDVKVGANKALSAEEILEQVRLILKEPRKDLPVITYLRRSVITELDAEGKHQKVTQKTHRAYSDERDQLLLEVDGRPATQKEIDKDRAHNLDRQQKFLHRQADKDSDHNEDLMVKNMDLFRKKFSFLLDGEERIQERECYVLRFIPDPEFSLDNRFVDRLMNAVRPKVWVDKKAFRIVRIETKLVESVSFLGGLAGVLRDIEINVDQREHLPDVWVDDTVSAFFDVRVFFKTYRFRLKSKSSEFEILQ